MAAPSFKVPGLSGPAGPKLGATSPATPMPLNVGRDVLKRTGRISKPRLTPNRNLSLRSTSR